MKNEFFMHRCLQLAEMGRQEVGNGAMVGSILVREEKIIAEGYHKKFGESHAEVELLKKYDLQIRSKDILYVSLEPCCHTGKNPPCTEIILERGIKNVVVGMLDPDPRVSGKGIAALRAAGVHVIGPILPTECGWLNRGFVSVRTKGRPWITLKSAKATNGKIANEDGSPLKITSDDQNVWNHTNLRAKHDAILVGVQTIINDDPILDTRLALGLNAYCPWRIILDPQLRIPRIAKVLNDNNAHKTIVITSKENLDRASDIQSNGAMVIAVAKNADVFDWNGLWSALLSPQGNDFNGLTSILVEGGSRTWEVFKKAGMVDMEVNLVSL